MKTTQRSKYFYGVQSLGMIADQNKTRSINQSNNRKKDFRLIKIFYKCNFDTKNKWVHSVKKQRFV